MSERPQRPNEVLGALPHRRPSRRSDKRATPAVADPGSVGSLARPSTPSTTAKPSCPRGAPPGMPRGGEIVGTMVQAAAELAEIGLSVTTRAIREAVARLPRP